MEPNTKCFWMLLFASIVSLQIIHKQRLAGQAVREETSSLSSDIAKAPEFPVDFDADSSQENIPSFQDQRPCSDPVNISNSSLLNGSYIGEVARSLGHHNEQSLLSFARLRHSSSMPNILDREKYKEMIRSSGSKGQKISGKVKNWDKTGSISPEISGLMLHAGDRDSDSDTLTDDSRDSGSHNGEFSFPPLKEIGGSAFVPFEGGKPVTLSTVTKSQAVIKPGARKGITEVKSSVDSNKEKMPTPSHRSQRPIHGQPPQFGKPNYSKQNIQRQNYQSEFRDEMDFKHSDLTNSFASDVSFPRPHAGFEFSNATLPVSSSAVDIVIMLQRIVGFGKVLCRTLTPARHSYESDHSTLSSERDEDFHFLPVFTKPRQKLYESFLGVREMLYTS